MRKTKSSKPKSPAPTLIWAGDINEEFLRELINYLQVSNSKRSITLCSEGGKPIIALGAIDILESVPTPILAVGCCFSAGLHILAAGKPGERRAAKGCRFMFHASSLSLGNQYLVEAEREIEEVKKWDNSLLDKLAEQTKRSPKWWFEKLAKQPWYFGVKEAKEVGLIDEIV
jgi:ATP-dependent Clp protease protease subunit